MNQETKICKNCHKDFVIEPDDFGFYEKMKVPPPTWCPDCRYQRRLVDRNEWNLYKRKCDFTGETIVSIYRPEVPFPVYKPEVWRSDKWDPMQYGRDFDFNRPFFEQYEELRRVVPHLGLVAFDSQNSEYSNQSQHNKDCYMVFASGSSEKCMYGNWFQDHCFFSADCSIVSQCELIYDSLDCLRCYHSAFLETCFEVRDSYFMNDCRSCHDCFGCVGLRSKSYCWFNEQLTKEEHEKRFKEVEWTRDTIKKYWKQLQELRNQLPTKYYHGPRVVNSSGDFIGFAKNTHNAFNSFHAENLNYGQDAGEVKDSQDLTEVLTVEQSYQLQGCATIVRGITLRSSWVMTDCYYCDMSFSNSDCFGCFGVRQKQYCILNKQYSKEDYVKLKARIIEHMKKTGEWGEYFPREVSPFGYNESIAQVYFPLIKEEALRQGYAWYDREESRNYAPTMKVENIPQKISDTRDSIVNEVIQCATQLSQKEKDTHFNCATAFKIVPLELTLYRKLGIPLPEKCFHCRLQDRLGRRNPRKLYHRQCMCDKKHAFHKEHCMNEFETSYAPERKEIIYCEQCYNLEVV